MKNLRKNKKGFTLVEVVVVLVIIAILIAIAVPAVMKYVDDANDAKLEAQARGAMIAAESELVKDFAEDGKLDQITGLGDTVKDIIELDVKSVNVFTTFVEKADKTYEGVALLATDSPNKAKAYEITIGTDTIIIEKNGKVVVDSTINAVPAPTPDPANP